MFPRIGLSSTPRKSEHVPVPPRISKHSPTGAFGRVYAESFTSVSEDACVQLPPPERRTRSKESVVSNGSALESRRSRSKSSAHSAPAEYCSSFHNTSASSTEMIKASAQFYAAKHELDYEDVERILKEFSETPIDDNGGMGLTDFYECFMGIFNGIAIDNDLVAEAYKEACVGDSDIVSCELFFRWYKRCLATQIVHLKSKAKKERRSLAVRPLLYELEAEGIPREEISKMKSYLQRIEYKKAGSIDYDEFLNFLLTYLKAEGISTAAHARVRNLWRALDNKSSGEVDYSQFAKWYAMCVAFGGIVAFFK
eukprot:TRINITY_DN40654_c0_g1_i1.p1 TRINITY_DN40654_c0_g1~~TRINITY_DN40654_c0_g1_i1.p1  ORF type:complete len:326 (+),score=42.54 TRINITY_DN40654_c0_g1_i1:46-978(+)